MTSDPEDRRPPSTDSIRLEQQLLDSLTRVWHRGWMPADVVAAVGFEMPPRVVALVTELIFAEHLQQDCGSWVSPRWQRQISSLGPIPAAAKSLSPMTLSDAADLHIALTSLPNLRPLGPLPGTGSVSAERVHDSPATPGETSDPDPLHSLDDPPDASAGPDAMRLAIERPYDREKFGLLSAAATANRCRAILHSQLGLATVMGFTVDLEAVELLYTSLLVQATRSMRAHGTRSNQFGASTTRSFLTGFAIRVGQRLRSRARIDASGYSAGVDAADRADLGARRAIAS